MNENNRYYGFVAASLFANEDQRITFLKNAMYLLQNFLIR